MLIKRIIDFFATSLQRKSMLAVSVLVTLVMTGFGVYLINSQRQNATTELEGRATRTVNLLVQTTALPFWNLDLDSLDAQFNAILADPEVNSISIYETGQEKPLIAKNRETAAVDPIVRTAEVTFQQGTEKNLLGKVEIVYSHELLYRSLNQTQILLAFIIIALILTLVFSNYFLVGRLVSKPLRELTALTSRVSTGDYTGRAMLQSRDEMSLLANAYNSMVAQLSNLVDSLEQRVDARTKDLAIVAELGTATATILETDRLLQKVADLTKERFNLYHSHIYLLNASGENLILAAGAGEPGRQMVAEGRSIPISREQSLVARAARERKGVTVNDVTQAPDFLPNPLLPDTRSELAVPIIIGGKVIGVFDIQSDEVGRFTASDINIQTTLAAQLATSIQNVRQFEQSKSRADLEVLVNTIGQKIRRAESVEEALQTAARELGMALGAVHVKASIGENTQQGNSENAGSN
jgi:putative methionine-R-sulfoxide reductase with GAF domain